MIRLLPVACGLAILGASPLFAANAAQAAASDAPAAGRATIAQNDSDNYGWRGRNWREDSRDTDEDRAGDRSSDDSWRGGSDRSDWREHMSGSGMMAGRMHNRGLRIRMRRGDASIDLRCPSASDYSSCISAVGQLIDKLDAKARSAGTGSSSGANTSPTPTPESPSNR